MPSSGGFSIRAGRLAELGYQATVLDISASAIERAKARNGAHVTPWGAPQSFLFTFLRRE